MKQPIDPTISKTVEHLRQVFVPETFEQAVALCFVVEFHEIRFVDGTVVNGHDADSILGHRDIASVVAILYEGESDLLYQQLAVATVKWKSPYAEILDRFRNSDEVAWIG